MYIICEDKKVADQVANYGMQQEEITQHHLQSLKNEQMQHRMQYDDSEREDSLSKSVNEENESTENDYVLMEDSVPLIDVTLISLKESI